MADFTVTEEHTTEYKISKFRKVYTLEAGEKLTDQADLVAIANKTVPAGYSMLVRVTIRAEVSKL